MNQEILVVYGETVSVQVKSSSSSFWSVGGGSAGEDASSKSHATSAPQPPKTLKLFAISFLSHLVFSSFIHLESLHFLAGRV